MTGTIATSIQPARRWRRAVPYAAGLAGAVLFVVVVSQPAVGRVVFWPIEHAPVLAWVVVAAALWLARRVAQRRGHRRLGIALELATGVSLVAPVIFVSLLLQANGWPSVLAFILPFAIVSSIFGKAMSSPDKHESPPPATPPAPPSSGAEPRLPPPWQAG